MSGRPTPITDPIDEFDDIALAMPTLTQTPAAPEILPAEPARPVDEQAIAHAAQSLVARAQAFHVTSPETYETAGLIIDELKRQKKAVEGFFAPMVEKAHAAWKALTSKRGSLTDPIDQALVVLQARYADYARRVREEAERERRRLEKEAQEREQARLRAEAEAREKEAEEARQAALQASTREEAQILEQQAEELQQTAEATRVEAATVQAPVLPLQSPIDVKKGPTVAQNWTWELLDKLALARAVVEGKVSSEAILENGSYLTKRAKADKGTATIPGVRFYDAGSVRASRGRR
ncbi:MAG: hypothetical protein IT577_16105 [Verrucomicrobiae bacterium]|nr:hypothetical protein [Verrucomicrobiae bacterium]